MERQAGPQTLINNEFYDHLDEGWYTACNHPVALLRAENKLRTPWIIDAVSEHFPTKISVLDIGCGAGILTNALAIEGHQATGIDLSENSLAIAKKFDATGKVLYKRASAYSLPFPAESFDAACALDVLEHVEEPQLLIAEASRVLKPGGLFFFHTFNRNPLSYLIVIKGVEWCVRNTPKNMHVYSLFIKPAELKRYCLDYRLRIKTMIGIRPKFRTRSFWKMIFTREVCKDFTFRFSKSLKTGYCGIAEKVPLAFNDSLK
jgi:2-polyprenyl-6-hydroxyphenyl methylase / 3-demethylubiquinone-9 3-methyltransferase